MTAHPAIQGTIRARPHAVAIARPRRSQGSCGVTRPLAVIVGVAMIMVAALAGATPARAASTAWQDVPGSQIAAALRKSPLYVDPSLSSAFPAAARKSILSAIRKAPTPVFVLAIPMVSGSQWSTSGQLADVIQNSLGQPGIYMTLDSSIPNDIDAYTWPSDPQQLSAPPYYAADAAQAVDITPYTTQNPPPVWQEFLQCIRIINAGKAESAYHAAQADLAKGSPGTQAADPSSDGGPIAGATLAAIAAGGAGAVALARRRRRRRRARSQAPLSAPRTVVDAAVAAARAATADDLRVQAQEQLIELGELLERPGPAGASEQGSDDQAAADLTRALDAYSAAAQVLDSASGIPDLAGVLVLTHMGRCAASAAQARRSGRPAPAATMLCFFNPLHGEASRPARWRAQGGHQALDVHACDACADAIAQRRFPSVLTAVIGGQDVPYYETTSVWATTGYGQTADLIKRIQNAGRAR